MYSLCFPRFNDEVKHIKVIEKDSWIHITEAKKFESLLVSDVILLTQKKHPNVVMWLLFNRSACMVTTGAGGVLSVPFIERELQVIRHHIAIPLQVKRTLANPGQHTLTR